MKFTGNTLDDILHDVFPALMKSGTEVEASRGSVKELLGVTIELTNPRARLSRSETRGKPFSCLGELLWYLSASDELDFITYYIPKYAGESEDDMTVHGAYGPRLFRQRGHDQIENVIRLLGKKTTTRRAVIQIFAAEDLSRDFKEIPCTTTCQFFVRDNALHMVITMRSNDAYIGLPHDVFCFTMMQEMVARRLDVSLGSYIHFASNLHLYSRNEASVRAFLDEGIQATWKMPKMPEGDPRRSVQRLLEFERKLRETGEAQYDLLPEENYWRDLGRLLHMHSLQGNRSSLESIQAGLHDSGYTMYARQIYEVSPQKPAKKALQLKLPL